MAKRRKLESGIEMDMTPMIDIVFLLIAFFMIVSDLSQLEIQTVILPVASEAKVPKPQAGERKVIINIVEIPNPAGVGVDYEIRIGGSKKGVTLEELTAALRLEAAKFEQVPGKDDSGKNDSLLKIVIRSHEAAPSKFVQQVWTACSKNRIFKTGLGALTTRQTDPYSTN